MLNREIAAKTERLKEIKALLVAEARAHKQDCTATDGGGLRWTATSTDGCVARVNLPAPALKSKFEEEDKVITSIRAVAGASFGHLFTSAVVYKPVENFRGEVATLLGKAEGKKLLKLCLGESAPRVSFEATQTLVA